MLKRLGLDRPELKAWALYDWAASPAQTTILSAIFPIYFTTIAGQGFPQGIPDRYWAIANSIAVAIIAVSAPVLGAIADYSAMKKKMLFAFLVVGTVATAAMFFVHSGDLTLAAILLVLVTFAASGTFVFYESLLPHIASGQEMDRVSTAGYALGYIGGGVLLALNIAWMIAPTTFGLSPGTPEDPDSTTLPARLAFLSVAIWWIVFSIPLFRRVSEPPMRREADERGTGRSAVTAAFIRLWETLHELRGFRQAFLLLVAFLIYNDGIGTIQRMAAVYATSIGIDTNAIIIAILLVQFVGVPATFAFGAISSRIGTKPSILLGLSVFCGIGVLGYFMRTATHFYVLAILVGLVQGGTQALSRSLFATMIPRYKSGEFFGFFSVFSKFAGIFGPLLFAYIQARTGSMRYGILSTIAFFAAGALLLLLVDVQEGEHAAERADAEALPIPQA